MLRLLGIWNTVIFLCLQNFCLPLGILLVMLQLIFIQGLWLTRKWLHVLLWDIPQQMQGSMRLLFSKCNTSCLYCGTCAWALTENNFCAVTFCSVVHSLFVKLRSILKMVLTGFVFLNRLVFIPCLHHFPCLHYLWNKQLMAFGTFVVSCPRLYRNWLREYDSPQNKNFHLCIILRCYFEWFHNKIHCSVQPQNSSDKIFSFLWAPVCIRVGGSLEVTYFKLLKWNSSCLKLSTGLNAFLLFLSSNGAVEKCINKYALYCWIDWLLDLS